MARKRYTAEQIIGKLREAEVALAESDPVAQVARRLGVTEQTADRWRREYGGLRVDEAKRRKEREGENARRKRLVADPALDNASLQEVSSGKLLSPARGRQAVMHVRTVCVGAAAASCSIVLVAAEVGASHRGWPRRGAPDCEGVSTMGCGLNGSTHHLGERVKNGSETPGRMRDETERVEVGGACGGLAEVSDGPFCVPWRRRRWPRF